MNPPATADVPEDKRASYTITFAPDATFSAQADCNTVMGGYTTANAQATAGDLTIVPGPTTSVACPPGSYGDFFVFSLAQASSYAIDATNTLTITLIEGGTLVFEVPTP